MSLAASSAFITPGSLSQAVPAAVKSPRVVSELTLPPVERNSETPELAGIKIAILEGKSLLKYFLDNTTELPQGLRILAALAYRGAQDLVSQDISAHTIATIVGVNEEVAGTIQGQCRALLKKGFVFPVSADTWAASPEVVAVCRNGLLSDCLVTFDKKALNCAAPPTPTEKEQRLPATKQYLISLLHNSQIPEREVQQLEEFAIKAQSLRLSAGVSDGVKRKLIERIREEGRDEGILGLEAANSALQLLKAGDATFARFLLKYVENCRKTSVPMRSDAA